jgi:hypothetical protein
VIVKDPASHREVACHLFHPETEERAQ